MNISKRLVKQIAVNPHNGSELIHTFLQFELQCQAPLVRIQALVVSGSVKWVCTVSSLRLSYKDGTITVPTVLGCCEDYILIHVHFVPSQHLIVEKEKGEDKVS